MGDIIKNFSKKLLSAIAFGLVMCLCVNAQTAEENPISDNVTVFERESDFIISDDAISPAQNNPEIQTTSSDSSTLWLFVRMILALVFVVAVIYGIVFVLKKGFVARESESAFLKKAASLTLAPGKSVCVITLVDAAWLVGVSDAGINLIGEINDKELVDRMILEAEKSPSSKPKDFASILSMFTQSAKQTEKTLQKQRERLLGGKNNE
ncbi:MAG: flagellar biosynthetic protein FliO [Spirochaetales bacterium]